MCCFKYDQISFWLKALRMSNTIFQACVKKPDFQIFVIIVTWAQTFFFCYRSFYCIQQKPIHPQTVRSGVIWQIFITCGIKVTASGKSRAGSPQQRVWWKASRTYKLNVNCRSNRNAVHRTRLNTGVCYTHSSLKSIEFRVNSIHLIGLTVFKENSHLQRNAMTFSLWRQGKCYVRTWEGGGWSYEKRRHSWKVEKGWRMEVSWCCQ